MCGSKTSSFPSSFCGEHLPKLILRCSIHAATGRLAVYRMLLTMFITGNLNEFISGLRKIIQNTNLIIIYIYIYILELYTYSS